MGNGSLLALQEFVATHRSWFREFVIRRKLLRCTFDQIYNHIGRFSKRAFVVEEKDNSRPDELYGGKFDLQANKKLLLQANEQSAKKTVNSWARSITSKQAKSWVSRMSLVSLVQII